MKSQCCNADIVKDKQKERGFWWYLFNRVNTYDSVLPVPRCSSCRKVFPPRLTNK